LLDGSDGKEVQVSDVPTTLAGRRRGGCGAEALMDTQPGDRIGEEQAALRRVAVLVAQGVPPEEIFAAVTAEVGQLLDADLTAMARYDQDKTMTYVARWSANGDDWAGPLRKPLDDRNVGTLVFETGRPARVDDSPRPRGEPRRLSGGSVSARASGRRSTSRAACGA
jgi:hypothetical protein